MGRKIILVLCLLLTAGQAWGAGSVTLANMKLSLVNGTAFVDFNGSDSGILTVSVGHKLTICSAANPTQCAVGYIKAVGSGETYDTTASKILVHADDFASTDGWTLNAGWAIDTTNKILYQAPDVGNQILAYKTKTVTQNACYYSSYTLTGAVQTALVPQLGASQNLMAYQNSAGTYSSYRISTTASGAIGFYSAAPTTTSDFSITAVSIKQVLTPAVTGVTIVSTAGGSTYNWASNSIVSGRNDATGYTYTITPICSTAEGGSGTCYVDSTSTGGDGTTSATSGSTAAISSLSVASFYEYAAGDSISIAKGSTFSGQQLVIGNSGSSGSPITIIAHGNGNKPIINPSTVLSSWTGPDGNGVYSATAIATPVMLFEDTIPLPVATSPACADGGWYFATTTMSYKPTSGTPSNHTVGYIRSSGTSPTSTHSGVNVSNRSYVTVDGIKFVNAWFGVGTSESTARSDNIIVQNCDFFYCANAVELVTASQSNNGSVLSNYFYRCGQAISLDTNSGADYPITGWSITDNNIVDFGKIDVTNVWPTTGSPHREGIAILGGVNCTIARNIINGGSGYGLLLFNSATSTSSGNTILSNRVESVEGSVALGFSGSGTSAFDGNIVTNNLILNNTATNIFDIAQGSGSASENLIVHNTFYGNSSIPLSIRGSSKYLTIENNLFNGNTGEYKGIYNAAVPDGTFICDYNLYGPGSTDFGSSNAAKTWAEWNALGYDTYGSMSSNAVLTTLYTLGANSPAIDAGTPVLTYAEAQAAGGTVYGAAPDIGAYEYRKIESTIVPRPIIFDAPQAPCVSTNAACYVQ